MIKKVDGCASNPKKYLTTKIGERIICTYSMPTIWAFDNIKNKHSFYLGKNCLKKFCVSLRKHVKNVINFEMKKMLLLTNKELNLHQESTVCYICRKKFALKLANDKNHHGIKDHSYFTGKYRGAEHNACINIQ